MGIARHLRLARPTRYPRRRDRSPVASAAARVTVASILAIASVSLP